MTTDGPLRIGVTGATGFVGRRLVQLAGDEPAIQIRVLTRNPAKARSLFPIPPSGVSPVEITGWDYTAGPPSHGVLADLDGVIHLAGENIVNKRWTSSQKGVIRDSRVLSTRALIEGLKRHVGRPKVLVSCSAVGFYGARGDEDVDESGAPGSDFLADVCQDWEAEARRAELHGLRVVRLRAGIVLGPGGGALGRMVAASKLFAGGPLGSGRQWMSWIHRDDLARLFLHAVQNQSIDGPLNATAPNPVTNRDFARILGHVLNRPSFLPAPRLGMRILLGEVADMLVTGQRVLPVKALKAGFSFSHGELEGALRQILGTSGSHLVSA